MKVIIGKSENGSAVMCVPSSESLKSLSVSEVGDKTFGKSNHFVTDQSLLPDYDFYGAWSVDIPSGAVSVSLQDAKLLAHKVRRAKRDEDFKPHDEAISKQIPGSDAQLSESSRASIRAADALIQVRIDQCETLAALKSEMKSSGLLG